MPIVPDKLSSYLRIGTCSWKYDSWKGLIYDADKNYKPDDYLEDYARYYNTVEIDQWSYIAVVFNAHRQLASDIDRIFVTLMPQRNLLWQQCFYCLTLSFFIDLPSSNLLTEDLQNYHNRRFII